MAELVKTNKVPMIPLPATYWPRVCALRAFLRHSRPQLGSWMTAALHPKAPSALALAVYTAPPWTPVQMFGGFVKRYKHESQSLGCSMTFHVFYPPAAENGAVPVRGPDPAGCAGAAPHSLVLLT